MTEDPPGDFGCVVNTMIGASKADIGDGGPAIQAYLNKPQDVMVGGDGRIYVADTVRHSIRVFEPGGEINTIAGTGTTSNMTPLVGDALEVILKFPRGMYWGPDGSIYFVEFKGFVVRRLSPDGTLSIVAGTGGADGPLGDGGPASRATIDHPTDVLIDDEGRVYFADSRHQRVRVVDPTGYVHTVAGNGDLGTGGDGGAAVSAQLKNPESLAFDKDGNLLIAGGGSIRRVDLSTGIISTVQGSFGATHVATDPDGAIFFSGPHIVMRIDRTGTAIPVAGTGFAGYSGDGGRATAAQLNTPGGIDFDSDGILYIADTGNHRIRRVLPDGTIETVAGRAGIPGDNVFMTEGSVSETSGMAFDGFGNLYFSDYQTGTIRRLSTLGFVSTVAGNRSIGFSGMGGHPLEATLNAPRALAFDSEGNLIFIDQSNDSNSVLRILPGVDGVVNGDTTEKIEPLVGIPGEFERRGEVKAHNVHPGEAVINHPRGLCIDPSGNLYIADWLGNMVLKVSTGQDEVVNGDRDERVTVLAGTGRMAITGNGGAADQASVGLPHWLACDSKGNVYTFEYTEPNYSFAIRKIDPVANTIEHFASTQMPTTMAFDSGGNMYLADTTRLFRTDSRTGARTHIAGVGTGGWSGTPGGYSGDGGDARLAQFDGLQFMAIDGNGDIFVMDSGNGRIRKVSFVSLEGADHPVFTATPVETPDELTVEVTQMVTTPTATQEVRPGQLELRYQGRLGVNDSWEAVYQFASTGFNIAVYEPDEWKARSNCDITGMSGNPKTGSVYVSIRALSESTRCDLMITLPHGLSTSVDFTHFSAAHPPAENVHLELVRRIGVDDRHPYEVHYEFYIQHLHYSLYLIDEWQVQTDCALRGFGGGEQDDLFTIAIAAYSPSQTCSLSITLPNGTNGTTTFRHTALNLPEGAEPEPSIQLVSQLGETSDDEIGYEFAIQGADLSLYEPQEWGIESNCQIIGMGGTGPDRFTIGLPSDLPSQDCTLSLTLPTGQTASTTFEHQR